MFHEYSFISCWEIKAPVTQVWNAIYYSLEWPEWWRGVISVQELKEGDDNGIGGIRQYAWRSLLPYILQFKIELVEKNEYQLLSGRASGELEGTGTWHFKEKDEITYVQYTWNVVTNKRWMNFFSFLLKPVFKINHDIIMRWGEEGLKKRLNITN